MAEKKKPQIECAKNGPYLVKDLEILEGLFDGKKFATKAVTALCRCGRSGNKPYCDGTQKKFGFSDE
jgi:CDGSH-type Zn-finger protein